MDGRSAVSEKDLRRESREGGLFDIMPQCWGRRQLSREMERDHVRVMAMERPDRQTDRQTEVSHTEMATSILCNILVCDIARLVRDGQSFHAIHRRSYGQTSLAINTTHVVTEG